MRARLIVPLLAACACHDAPAAAPTGAHNILFIGNSLTYTNDLPGTFAALTAAANDTWHAESVAHPNVALIDFFSDGGEALAAIDRGAWDFVVLQQGPTYPGLCSDTLSLAAQMFGDRIRAKGGSPALLMTWPTNADRPYFSGVHQTYAGAAADANAVFIPGGDAWRLAWNDDASLALYGPDDYHPSPLGTYLTALVIYERITGHDARLLPTEAVVNGQRLDAPAETIMLLQRAAHQAVIDATALPGVRLRLNSLANVTC